jgi:vancomycin resistance protein YoaR
VRITWAEQAIEVPLAALGIATERGRAIVTDERRLREQCDRLSGALGFVPPFDGDLEVTNDDVVPVYPEPGEALDCDALERAIDARVSSGRPLVVRAKAVPVAPSLDGDALDSARAEVKELLRAPVELDATGPWSPAHATVVLDPDAIRVAVRLERDPDDAGRAVLALDPAALGRSLAPLSALGELAEDARFEIDPATDRVRVRPSRSGLSVDARRLFADASAAAKRSSRKGTLAVGSGEPVLSTKQAEALHIKGLVASFTTRHPCCQPRVTNIHRIADLLDGAVVSPGARFSVNHHVGPRSKKRGFVLAPSIGEGEMVDSYGGGVSQVATTLYNAVFDAGYVVVTRKPHSYYFSRYPMGIEATLSWPRPDLVFRNDSNAGILIRVAYTDERVTVKLYGDVEGRKVKRFRSKPFDFTDPRVEYEPDEALAPDDPPKTVSHGTQGFHVKAGRDVVFVDGTTKHEERIVRYRGRPRVLRAHPCAIPRGEKGHRKKGCPKPAPREEVAASAPEEKDMPEPAPTDDAPWDVNAPVPPDAVIDGD